MVTDAAGEDDEVWESPNPADLSSSVITNYERTPSDSLTTGEQRNGTSIRYAKYRYLNILQGSQTRTFKSDSLGRLVSETHPENGTTAYTYNDVGSVLVRTDARGITTTSTYDVLNRPTFVDYSDATPDVTTVYDLGAYGIGRVYSASNAWAASIYSYDEMGRVIQEQKTINGIPFSTSTSYSLAGQPLTRTLGNGTVISQNYNAQ